MMSVFRTLGAVFAGTLVAFALIVLVEIASAVVHPFPEGTGNTMEEICQHVERYPGWVLAAVVPLYGATAFLGAWVAKRLGNLVSFAIVGLLLMTASLCNIAKLPYPMWFKVSILIVIPVAIILGGRLLPRRNLPEVAVAG